MISNPFTLYKLMILYMLKTSEIGLNTSQISDFMVMKDYTQFLTQQQVLSELLETDLIHHQKVEGQTIYSITEVGEKTLACFQDDIPTAVIKDIKRYIKENISVIRNELSVFSSYTQISEKKYLSECIINEQDEQLLEIRICLPGKDLAETVSQNWKAKSQQVYEMLLNQLLSSPDKE